jgi:hypothetical protein
LDSSRRAGSDQSLKKRLLGVQDSSKARETRKAKLTFGAWKEAEPVDILDAPVRDLNDILFRDKTYVYHVPGIVTASGVMTVYRVLFATDYDTKKRDMKTAAGDVMDGVELRINVGVRQRTFGDLPKVVYREIKLLSDK